MTFTENTVIILMINNPFKRDNKGMSLVLQLEQFKLELEALKADLNEMRESL